MNVNWVIKYPQVAVEKIVNGLSQENQEYQDHRGHQDHQ